ncbi:cytochrome C oxidase subunit II [Porphyromonas crevioricanis]|uniref:Cytochrome d ubiquinol oxidase subunit 1 n=1 Tax=Porphyromonas crevioricanis TaxID=393921 RepID=A0A0A2FJL1_9PORP|nr:cytochrome ubiquinol oxidase subunit I [Porphyromonas crevioricanis]KGN90287.1 cytochrome C oxidase subunit II [Porphyromonas crevioricanis]SQH72726.1 Cytochrome d ubiquinol oxidase subunit 1 [Porphyromonas crevioricanis]
MDLDSLLYWSRAQFAMTAMYHWLFVPLTLGLGIIMAMAETKYYRSGEESWKRAAKFWQKLFGINFAIGVATGLILEFEFGTNWSNYSWFVGDIFGAPLAIEGILAFFMEATFIAVMFFGWGKVSKGFHLTSTWLTIIGASISAVWILVANAWMQHPVGMEFNPDTVRSEMNDFWAVALSPVAINKFFHTITSCWLLGSIFAMGVCGWFLLRKHHERFAVANIKMIAPFGLIAALLTAYTGDESAFQVADKQPMKLAAMEALYDTGASDAEGNCQNGEGVALSAFGLLNPKKEAPQDEEPPFLFNIEVPRMLSLMGTRSSNGYVPGINNILNGGYTKRDGSVALPADSMIAKGKEAIQSLAMFRDAKQRGDETAAATYREELDKNFEYFGYGYLNNKEELVPNVPLTYYSFRVMVGLGTLFIILFITAIFLSRKSARLQKSRWMHIAFICSVPLAYIASQCGWIVAEVGRQPWAIQNLMPLRAAISKLDGSSVMLTFFVFLVLFSTLLVAELNIMFKAIKQGVDESDRSPEKE